MTIEELKKVLAEIEKLDYCATHEEDGFAWGFAQAKERCAEILETLFAHQETF